jgi:hypothetical protein
MSESESISSIETNDSCEDYIENATNELENIIEIINHSLNVIDKINKSINGPLLTIDGKTQAFKYWLTDWENEMKHDTFHKITWGQFVIEKLSSCTEDA